MKSLSVYVRGLKPKYPRALVVSFVCGFGFVGLLFLLKSLGIEGAEPLNPYGERNPFDVRWWVWYLIN